MTVMRVETDVAQAMARLKKRGVLGDPTLRDTVARIIDDVAERGDAAVLDSARRYDSPESSQVFALPESISGAAPVAEFQDAIRLSIQRVRAFHVKQREALLAGFTSDREWRQPEVNGGYLGQRMTPLDRVGVYVPGGEANYPSSVIMNAVPALEAGVREVIISSPVRKDGQHSEEVRFAARELGIAQIIACGGAAAIAAMALGTETITRVDKIVGPGNRFVNEAKRQLWGRVGLDGYAGPSEVCVVVDETANPAFAGADLLTQVEHAEDNQGFLVATSSEVLEEVLGQIEKQLDGAPRASTMRKALADHGLAIVCTDLQQLIDVVNLIAPEHLTLSIRDSEKISPQITNAGCILHGDWTPESAGDFVLGPSHTLPTATAARFGSPVNILDFWKVQSISSLTSDSLDPLIPAIEAFGRMEGFPAHGQGATVRRVR